MKSSLASFYSLTCNCPFLLSYLGNFLFEKIYPSFPHPPNPLDVPKTQTVECWYQGMQKPFLGWVKSGFVVHALLTYYPNIWAFCPSSDLT